MSGTRDSLHRFPIPSAFLRRLRQAKIVSYLASDRRFLLVQCSQPEDRSCHQERSCEVLVGVLSRFQQLGLTVLLLSPSAFRVSAAQARRSQGTPPEPHRKLCRHPHMLTCVIGEHDAILTGSFPPSSSIRWPRVLRPAHRMLDRKLNHLVIKEHLEIQDLLVCDFRRRVVARPRSALVDKGHSPASVVKRAR